VTVELCADRACSTIVQQITATGGRATATSALAAGHIFWRVRAGTETSATWEAFVPHRSATPSAALATRPDYDGDGFGDFVLDDRVLLGGPSGYMRSFPLPRPTPAADATVFVQAGDLNGDGFGDVLRLDGSDEQTPFGIWSPTPLFGGPTGFTAGSATSSVMPYGPIYSAGPAGDVNADGYADFLFKTRFTPATYMGGAAGLSDGPIAATEGSQSFYAFGADYDGDGFADAASMTNGVPTVLVTRGGPAGFDASGSITLTPPLPPEIANVVTIDGNGDGYADLAVGTETGDLQILAGSASGLSATPIQTLCPSCEFVGPIGTGDFNGDGFPDLVAQEGMGATLFFVHYGTASGFSETSNLLSLPQTASVRPDSISDVNGDGFEDVTAELYETVTDASGAQTIHVTGYRLFLGGAGGLTPAP
jgi:FG-GAP-like repeat